MKPDEVRRVEAYLRRTLNPKVALKARARAQDSVELYVGEEFLGLCYRIDDEGETSFQVQITVLEEDLG
jgi:hypothetical protein